MSRVKSFGGAPAVAGRVAAVYAVSAIAWLFVSDQVVDWLLPASATRAYAELASDMVFVAVTAWIVQRFVRRQFDLRQLACSREDELARGSEENVRILRALFANSRDAIYVKDVDGRCLLLSRGAERVAGLAGAELFGQTAKAFASPGQVAAMRRNEERVMRNVRAETFEETVDTADGRSVFSSTRIPLCDETGTVVGLLGISQDVTAAREVQHALHDTRLRDRLLFDANPVPMWVFDRDSLAFVDVNEAATVLYRYDRATFMAMTVADLLPAGTDLAAAPMLARSESWDPPMRQVGTRTHRCGDGSLIDVEISIADLPLDDRRTRLVVALDVTERRELHRQAAAAHDVLRDVLARIDDGFVALDDAAAFTYLNQRAASILQQERVEDLLGKPAWTTVDAPLVHGMRQACERARETRRHEIFDYQTAPGSWFEVRVYPSVGGLSVYLADISERKDAEQALLASEQRYRLAASRGQIWEWTADGNRLAAAPKFWAQLGVPQPEADQTFETFKALVHPEDVDRWLEALAGHLERRAPYDLELRVRHASGEWHWFHTQGQAMWDADGRATYMAGVSYDISDRRRAEQALQEAEAYRRNVFDQLGDGVFMVDRDQRFTDANARALAMLGYEHHELLALIASDILSREEQNRIEREIATVMDGLPHFDRWQLRRKDGSEFCAEISARRLDARHYVSVVRDISVRVAREEALRDSQRELSELTRRLMLQERVTLQRVAQALHDHVGQTLGAARLNLDALLCPPGSARGQPRDHGDRLAVLLDQAIGEVRQVLADLRPPLLDAKGLTTALATEIESLVVSSRDVDVLLEVDDATATLRWPPEVEFSAFMIAREAIANAQQHADASLVRVLLAGDPKSLDLQVIDDGRGIPAPMMRGRVGHLGIVGMRERATIVGATFGIRRGPDGGTHVSCRWEAREAA